jgi:LysR family glycine cleavage system transcriptional activator
MRSRADWYIVFGMVIAPFKLPGTSALTAFEASARLGAFTRAAAALNTSQPAISRHIGDLEARLGVVLFRREPTGLTLTREGRLLYQAVSSGLGQIRDAMAALREEAARPSVSIACSYDNAHLIVMPRYGDLAATMGGADLRVLAVEFEHIADLRGENIDVAIVGGEMPDRRGKAVRLMPERVVPVASPGFVARAGGIDTIEKLAAQPLLALAKRNFGWMDWPDWFARAGVGAKDGTVAASTSRARSFPNYVYVLEAAAAGEGVALGWRGYIEGYEKAGRLLRLPLPEVATEGGCYAHLDPVSPVRPLVDTLLARLTDLL